MSRWNDELTLLGADNAYQDATGAWHEGERTRTEVFCNRFTMSLTSSATAVDMGLRDAVQVQVHTVDYDGQDQCEYHGEELDVTYVQRAGDMTTLTLGRKVGSNG